MSAAKERICLGCGVKELTASKAKHCAKCYVAEKSRLKRIEEQSLIEKLGYSNVSLSGYNEHGKPQWTFTHHCGTQQTWVFGNILKRLKEDPESVHCSRCGGKRRAAIATAGFVAKYGITEEQMVEYERYCKKVRHLSDKVYKQHLNEINPHNYKRGQTADDWHLDHIQPIIEGFKLGLPVEFMARKENLQMLTSTENLSKGRK